MKIMLTAVICVISMMVVPAAPAVAQGLAGATVSPEGKSGAPAERGVMKARMEERCRENPKQCEEATAKMKERNEQCRADPQKCRDEMKSRFEERCKANPKLCAELQAKMAQRQEQCKAHPEQCRPGGGRRPDGN